MSIMGLGAKILMSVKYEVGDAKSALKSLGAEERKLADQRIKSAEAENKRLDGQIKGIGLMAAGFAAATVAINIADKAMDAYAKTSSVAAAEVEKIHKDLDKSMDKGMEAVGRLVVSLGPLIEALSDVVGLLAEMESKWEFFSGSGFGVVTELFGEKKQNPTPFDYFGASAQRALFAQSAKQTSWRAMNANPEIDIDPIRAAKAKAGSAAPSVYDAKIVGYSTDGLPIVAFGDERAESFGAFGGLSSSVNRYGARADSVSRDMYGREIGLDTQGPLTDRLTSDWEARMAKLRGEDTGVGSGIRGAQKTQLEKIFGTTEELSLYTESFNMLTGAVSAAMDAWITGSESAGTAIRKFIAGAMKGIAIQMSVEAIKHGAMYLGSIAFDDYIGAAKHGAAAQSFAAGAVAAGLAAKLLGGGGGSSVSASGGGGSSPSAPNSVGHLARAERTDAIIVVGDNFAQDSPRNRQIQAKRLVKSAIGTKGVVYE